MTALYLVYIGYILRFTLKFRIIRIWTIHQIPTMKSFLIKKV